MAEAAQPGGAGRWSYWRWHGSPRMYYDAYDERRLTALATALRQSASRGRPAWCMFDNTAGGHAIADAMRLQQMLAEEPSKTAGARQSSRKAPQPR
jgi:uncharacterized protein YecE (DUF72 family)